MNWIELKTLDQLEEIKRESTQKTILIFKHSTRCNISRMTIDRLERQWKNDGLPETICFYLDLIRYREVSNAIADLFQVEHQSPQILLISNGKSVLDLSHYEIEFGTIKNSILTGSGLSAARA